MDVTTPPEGRLLRAAPAVREVARAGRRAAAVSDDAGAGLLAARDVDWAGTAADGFRAWAGDLRRSVLAAGDQGEGCAGDLEALAAAVEQLTAGPAA